MADTYRKPAALRVAPDRSISLSRPVAWSLAAAGSLLLTWSCATAWYLVFRDEIAQGLVARQTEIQYGYEDRIADLSGRLEREVTAGSVERRGFAARTDAIAARQAEIEARQVWLNGLVDRLAGPTPRPVAHAASPVVEAEPGAKPVPVPAEPVDLRLRRAPGQAASERRLTGERLSAAERSVGRVADLATGSADMLRRHAHERALRLRLALDSARLDPRRFAPEPAAAPVGGPLVPLPPATDASAFGLVAADAEAGVADLDRLLGAVRTLPLRRPLDGTAEVTSPFGYRVDPFTHGAALHTGLDLRAEPGSPVRATAGGRVTAAEPSGGYGNMVEIEHGNGIATRYGHLMTIGVLPGQLVVPGQVIGRVGSTGRSTGFHLHYETRIDGEPVNPTRFLDAGRLLPGADPVL